MTEIKPIETHYKGYRFRSKLEAKWGVFFDALGINWEYEPEGYVLPSGKYYLPDFLIHGCNGYEWMYEIKPLNYELNPEYVNQISELGRLKILSGDPVEYLGGLKECEQEPLAKKKSIFIPDLIICPRCGNITDNKAGAYTIGSGDAWFYCMFCDWDTPSGGGHETEVSKFGFKFHPHKGDIVLDESDVQKYIDWIVNAALKARSSRFDHGENAIVSFSSLQKAVL